jgi:hypothetical protein
VRPVVFNPNSRPTALVGYILNQTAKPEQLQPDWQAENLKMRYPIV